MNRLLVFSALLFCHVIVASAQQQDPAVAIDEGTLRGHIRYLADDLLEGRGPGSRGDDLTQLYIATQFQVLGLKPAAADGSWLQPVPLIGAKTHWPADVTFRHGDQSVTLKSVDEFMSTIGRPVESVSIKDAEVVFVGYGIEAPEYEWDDYKDVDLRGKVLLMMNNDPSSDPELFEGRRRLDSDAGTTSTRSPREKTQPARSSFTPRHRRATLGK